MKFKTKKEHLSEAIKKVLPFTGKANDFKDIKFQINGNILKIMAQSESASVVYKLNVVADENFDFNMRGSEINNIIETFNETITISKERQILTVAEGKTKLQTACNMNEMPIKNMSEENAFEIGFKDLKNGLIKTMDFAEKKQQTGVTTGVYVAFENHKLKVAGLDGNMLSFCEYHTDIDISYNCILPINIVKELVKIDADFVKICYSNSRVKFDFDYMEITTNLINGKYPKIETLFKVNIKEELEISKEHLLSTLKKANLIATKDTFVINFEIDQEEIKISFLSSAKVLSDYIACEFSGEKRTMKLNCELLPTVVKNCDNIIKIGFSDNNPMATYITNGNNKIILMMCT